jgi:hypothetical protein
MGSLNSRRKSNSSCLMSHCSKAIRPASTLCFHSGLLAGTASRSGAAWCSCTTTARSGTARCGAAWCCTARSCVTALRSLDLAALRGLRSLAALGSRSIASDQSQCQQGTKREHDLTNHFELLARPRNIHLVVGRLRDATFPNKPSLVRTVVYVDISSESEAQRNN